MEDQHNFRITPDDVDDEESDLADILSETKPRILLMGLKRFVSIVTFFNFLKIFVRIIHLFI